MTKRILLLFLFVFFPFSLLYPCEPCFTRLSLKETIQRADLIIVGQKEVDGPMVSGNSGDPDWIQIKIFKIIKGSLATGSSIKVNSFNGMCPYGVIINDNKKYLLLLRKDERNMGSHDYDAVEYGCSEAQFLIENDKINIDSKQISVDDVLKITGE